MTLNQTTQMSHNPMSTAALPEGFHPITVQWFQQRFAAPTAPQLQGWPKIMAGQHTLIAAPTGSGKTLTAFLVCIDRLLRLALAGKLTDETRVLYVSPLKALSNDVRRNLETPLSEIVALAREQGYQVPDIRALVRTGDTQASARAAMLRRPPHILVTTPESLFLLLTSDKSREKLRTVDTLIIDEIHALVRDKRGSHLALSIERLAHICHTRPVRIGLSATQKPIEEVASFLIGNGEDSPTCEIIDTGHQRELDLGIEVPASELGAVCSNEQWEEVYFRLKQLIDTHRSTLVFVNTRKLAERVAFNLSQHLGEEHVASHHGSLSRERRLSAEERLKNGELKVIVATASLELGIDVGYIDLVCQVGSPRSIATFLQRVGRSGHALGLVPKGRLIAMTRDELLEALALIHAIRQGKLDRIVIPTAPLDILAQQIAAAAAVDEWTEEDLYNLVRRAYPYRHLSRATFDEVVMMLADGYAKGGNRRNFAFIHRDGIHGKIRGRPGTKLAALTSGGAIPDQGDYRVVLEGEGSFIGTVNEDFAIESSAGDVFLLGNTSWQIAQVRGGEVIVRDANGAPPSIPFWLGEAPGRTVELSKELSDLRSALAERIPALLPDDPLCSLESIAMIQELNPPAYQEARQWLKDQVVDHDWANLQAVHYMAVQQAALGIIPTQQKVVFERFFDDTGGMQLVIHSPFGMRINKGFGLALRKRFCRSFDFELQASADDNGVVLSLGPQHSFPIEQLFKMLNGRNVRTLLEQALLAVPLFQIRWRWNANRSLAVLRMKAGKRVPPAMQRFRSDDLMSAVFPAQTQCKEHVTGDIEIPDHPLVRQTMHDCLNEAIDIDGLISFLDRVESGDIEFIARDTREPSPFSYQLLNANPYAFLDDAPLEERRARAVATRRTLAVGDMKDLGALDEAVIEQVREEAWPLARTPDELHDVLEAMGLLPMEEVQKAEAQSEAWMQHFQKLCNDGRASLFTVGGQGQRPRQYLMAAENLDLVQAAYAGLVDCKMEPEITLPPALRQTWTPEDARLKLLRGQMEARGVVTSPQLAQLLSLPLNYVEASLPAIEARGEVVRGRFSRALGNDVMQWCDRRLLIRIHRLTLDGLRRQIKPVTPQVYLQYLAQHHGMTRSSRREGVNGVLMTITQLAGFETAAGSWEAEILPSRVRDYQKSWLDELCHNGQIAWGRLQSLQAKPDTVNTEDIDSSESKGTANGASPMNRLSALTLVPRVDLEELLPLAATRRTTADLMQRVSGNAQSVLTALTEYGAQFFDDLTRLTRLLPTQLEEALSELIRAGSITADGFSALRPFIEKTRKTQREMQRGLPDRFRLLPRLTPAGGRWSLFPPSAAAHAQVIPVSQEAHLQRWVHILLLRYGVLFRELLAREANAPAWSSMRGILRQLEAQGEIRGGRFVAGVAGEQYALPTAVDELRKMRDQISAGHQEDHQESHEWLVISAADPLNLSGIIGDGERLSPQRLTRLVLKGGRFVARANGDDVTFSDDVPQEQRAAMRQALILKASLREAVLFGHKT